MTSAGSDIYRIGIDLGGTKIEGILLSPQGEVRHRARVASPARAGYADVVVAVVSMIADAASHVPPGASWTVGVGIPGSVDERTGLVRNANSTCLIGEPFPLDIERAIGRPVTVRNDADCFTIAECRQGAGRGHGLVFGVIMGTGCGGGIAIDGVVREGPHRISGEWGHLMVDPQGAPCYCGGRGCVETKISGSGVENAFFRTWGERRSMEEIVAGYRRGEVRETAAFRTFLDDFGRCLGGIISILDPDAVVLGGGLSGIDELYGEGVEHVRRYAFHDSLATPVLRNDLGDAAGVFGAAWIAEAP